MSASTTAATTEQTAEQTAAALASLRRVTTLRAILKTCTAGKVEGVRVDTFSASAFVQVYDGLTAKHRVLLLSLPLRKAINICFLLLK